MPASHLGGTGVEVRNGCLLLALGRLNVLLQDGSAGDTGIASCGAHDRDLHEALSRAKNPRNVSFIATRHDHHSSFPAYMHSLAAAKQLVCSSVEGMLRSHAFVTPPSPRWTIRHDDGAIRPGDVPLPMSQRPIVWGALISSDTTTDPDCAPISGLAFLRSMHSCSSPHLCSRHGAHGWMNEVQPT